MSYQALYRQWRPQNFDEVIGQNHIITPLKNQIVSGTYGHAYIFSGTRGTGKTSTAKIFARAVNCLSPDAGNPCNQCENCLSILEDQFIDVVEMDAASNNSVEDIRELREHVKFSPSKGKYKVYIIDEVHMLSQGAFNALLKTLEEPPSYVMFLLATTELQKIPATILSRCQRYDFKRVSYDAILKRLKHVCNSLGVDYEDDALRLIIEKSDGAVRDSLSGLDQCLATTEHMLRKEDVIDILGIVEKTQLLTLAQFIAQSEVEEALKILDHMVQAGKDLTQLLNGMIALYRDLLVVKNTSAEHHQLLIPSSEAYIASLVELSEAMTPAHISRALDLFIDLSKRIKFSSNKRILIEAIVFKLTNPVYDNSFEALLERIEKLEKGVVVQAPVTAPTKMPLRDTAAPVPSAPQVATVEHTRPSAETNGEQTVEAVSSEVEAFVEFAEGDLTLEAVETHYKAFLSEVSEKKKALSPFFDNSKPVAVKGMQCTIALTGENKLFIGVLTNPSNLEALNHIMSTHVKKNVQLTFIVSDEASKPSDMKEEVKNYFEAYKNVLEIKED